jgi:hypothetical protein
MLPTLMIWSPGKTPCPLVKPRALGPWPNAYETVNGIPGATSILFATATALPNPVAGPLEVTVP